MCFAINNLDSFNEVKELYSIIKRAKDPGEPIAFVVAANKTVRTLFKIQRKTKSYTTTTKQQTTNNKQQQQKKTKKKKKKKKNK